MIIFFLIFQERLIMKSGLLIFKMDLTDKQLTLWRQLGSDFSAPPYLCQQALTFYQSYKHSEHYALEKADLVLRVAYFLAQKAQVLYDREGRKLKSVAISANSLLRDHPKHEEFLYHLLQMVRSITIPPQASHLEDQVAIFSRHFSSALTFLNKLRTTLRKIKVSRKGQEPPDYQQLVNRLLWLVFIDCRTELQMGTDIIESTCLLGCLLSYFTAEKYQQQGIFSIYFQHDNQGCTLSNQLDEISSFMMSYFHVKDSNTYLSIYKKMGKYFDGISRSVDLRKFFHSQNVAKNVYFLQKLYEKKIVDGRLDQSTFLKGSTLSNHQVRVTPFGRRAPLASKAATALSHRILSYEHEDQIQESKHLTQNKKEQKTGLQFLNKLKLHPTPKGILIRATPMSQAMQLYNWLFEKSGRYILSKQQLTFIDQIFASSIINQHNQSKRDHRQLAGGCWKEMLHKVQLLSPSALLLISVYITCHVLNTPTNDIKVPMELLSLSEFVVWQALDYLINNFDRNMPLSLKINLLTLETSFISRRLWNNLSQVEQIQIGINNQSGRLVRRVIHQGAYTLHFLTKKLQLTDDLSDVSFLIFQQALQIQQNLLFEKMLEQVLACSLYAAAKVKQHPLKFNQILAALKEVLGMASGPFDELVEAVKMGQKRQNIIIYYNILFVPSVKQFLKQLRNSNGIQSSPGLINSKVKELVVREATALSSPQIASYFAYCESPMLKNRCLRELNMNSNAITNTIKRETTYSLQDIESKFGKLAGNGLKQTRKIKH